MSHGEPLTLNPLTPTILMPTRSVLHGRYYPTPHECGVLVNTPHHLKEGTKLLTMAARATCFQHSKQLRVCARI